MTPSSSQLQENYRKFRKSVKKNPMDDKFTLENVRLCIIEKGGKCTNHDLVSRFKPFLNDPVKKLENRNKLKDFVHLLASVETENGEKLLVLKKRYREHGCFNLKANEDSSPIVSPQVNPDSINIPDRFTQPEPVRYESVPPPSRIETKNITPTIITQQNDEELSFYSSGAHRKQASFNEPTPPSISTVQDDVRPAKSSNLKPSTTSYQQPTEESSELGFYSSVAARRTSASSSGYSTVSGGTAVIDSGSSGTPSRTESFRSLASDDSNRLVPASAGAEQEQNAPPNTELPPEPVGTPIQNNDGTLKKTPLSAKDRIKQFDMISANEAEEQLKAPPRRNNRESRHITGITHGGGHHRTHSHDSDDTESSSIPTVSLEPYEKEWMMMTSSCDYNRINKLLREHPGLAHKRDFISGYNAMHWAAKHDKPELIKLLNGYKVDPNQKSHCGYTPLHLAAMGANEECIDLLVNLCDAQPNIRDFYGRRAKQYLKRSCSTRIQQMLLNAARPVFTDGPNSDDQQNSLNFSRTQSFSAKVKSTTQAFARKLSTSINKQSLGTEAVITNSGASPITNRRLSSTSQSPQMNTSRSFNDFASNKDEVQMRRAESMNLPLPEDEQL